jgi:hypothetical protein
MSSLATGGTQLENVMYRLMDYLSEENAGREDTMIMLSLVNLLGIVSVMNKQWAAGVSASRSPGEDPLLSALMKMMANQQERHPAGGGAPALGPELLMGLLGSRAQSPENALLLALLNKMMHSQPPGPPIQERIRPGPVPDSFKKNNEGVKKDAGGQREAGGQGSVLNWDRRLG